MSVKKLLSQYFAILHFPIMLVNDPYFSAVFYFISFNAFSHVIWALQRVPTVTKWIEKCREIGCKHICLNLIFRIEANKKNMGALSREKSHYK